MNEQTLSRISRRSKKWQRSLTARSINKFSGNRAFATAAILILLFLFPAVFYGGILHPLPFSNSTKISDGKGGRSSFPYEAIMATVDCPHLNVSENSTTELNKISYGYVNRSVDLLNGTVLKGNSQPQNVLLSPLAVFYDQFSGDLYVDGYNYTNSYNRFIIMNATSGNYVGSINLSGAAQTDGFLLDPKTGLLYVSLITEISGVTYEGALAIINLSANRLIKEIYGFNQPHGIALDSITGNLYVADYGNNTVAVFNTTSDQIIRYIGVGPNPYGIVFDPKNRFVYVSNSQGNVAISDSNSISMINTSLNVSYLQTIPAGVGPGAMVLDPTDGLIYVLDMPSNPGTLAVINTTNNSFQSYIYIPHNPSSVVYDVADNSLYITTSSGLTLFNVSSNRVISNYSVYYGLAGVTIDATNGITYATNPNLGRIYSFDPGGDAINRIFYTFYNPYGLAIDPTNGYVYVSEPNTNSIISMNATTDDIVATISLGSPPNSTSPTSFLQYAPSSGYLYISNQAGDEIYVVNTSNNKIVSTIADQYGPESMIYDSFNENVYVQNNLGPIIILNSTTNSIVGTINAGTGGLAYNSENHDIYIAGGMSSDVVNIVSSSTDTIIGNITSNYLANPEFTFYDINNTFLYVVDNGYGEITVINTTTNSAVGIISVDSPITSMTYDQTNGYLYGTTGTNHILVINTTAEKLVTSITVGTNSLMLAYDPFNYEVYVSNYGSFSISVVNTVIKYYSVVFTETNLPPHTDWAVKMSGTIVSSSNSSIMFMEQNGTYDYTIISSNNSWFPFPMSGKLTIISSPLSENVTFTLVTYTVTFVELGLPSGTNWSVKLAGIVEYSTYSAITFSEPNGTYTYKVSNLTDYYTSDYSGEITINGASQSLYVSFPHYSYITGTITPSNAIITVNGNPITVTNGEFNLTVTSGSYALKASSPGYYTFYRNLTLIGNQTFKLAISLSVKPSVSTTPAKSSPVPYLYIGIGAAAAIVLVAAAIAASRKKKQK